MWLRPFSQPPHLEGLIHLTSSQYLSSFLKTYRSERQTSNRTFNNMTSPHFPNHLANDHEVEHHLFKAAVYDLEQWVAVLPHLSGADITLLWPHLRRKIEGLEMYSPAGTRNQQIRILLRLTRLLQGCLGVFPMCKRILRKVIEERVELWGGVEKRPRTQVCLYLLSADLTNTNNDIYRPSIPYLLTTSTILESHAFQVSMI